MSDKGTYLLQSQWHLLQDWGEDIDDMFGSVPFQVGSSLERKDYRDVDVRLILADDRYDALAGCMDVQRLNDVVSMWGQQVTGLPIDFQVQRRTEANAEYKSNRNALFKDAAPSQANKRNGGMNMQDLENEITRIFTVIDNYGTNTEARQEIRRLVLGGQQNKLEELWRENKFIYVKGLEDGLSYIDLSCLEDYIAAVKKQKKALTAELGELGKNTKDKGKR